MKEQRLEEYVAGLFDVDTSELFTSSRRREAVSARQVCWIMMNYFTVATSIKMGEYFNRDHATVLHNLQTANNHYRLERDFARIVDTTYSLCLKHSLIMPFTWVEDDDYTYVSNYLDQDVEMYLSLAV